MIDSDWSSEPFQLLSRLRPSKNKGEPSKTLAEAKESKKVA